MPLMRICRCGKKIDYSKQMCDACMNKYKKSIRERNKRYDKEFRNRQSQQFYNSNGWNEARKAAINRDHGLCRLCHENNKINSMDLVHHIEEVKDNKELRYSLNNLICLCNRCHNEVHRLYKSKTSIIKEKLKDIIEEGFI